MTLQEQRRLAQRLIKLHEKPYDPDTSDDDNRKFEELALKLALAIVAAPKPRS